MNMKRFEVVLHRSGGDRGGADHDRALHPRRRRHRDAAVELAAAAALRLAAAHVAPGVRTAGALPDPVRRVRQGRGWGRRSPKPTSASRRKTRSASGRACATALPGERPRPRRRRRRTDAEGASLGGPRAAPVGPRAAPVGPRAAPVGPRVAPGRSNEASPGRSNDGCGSVQGWRVVGPKRLRRGSVQRSLPVGPRAAPVGPSSLRTGCGQGRRRSVQGRHRSVRGWRRVGPKKLRSCKNCQIADATDRSFLAYFPLKSLMKPRHSAC